MASVPFLKDIAEILLKPNAYDIPNTCVVFPNKRARLFLSRTMGEITSKVVWAPQYLTITELMEKISGFIYADRLSLLFELYHVYKKATGSDESFDSFYPYIETLLADFDEMDKYLVDADDLFGNLSGLKSMEGRFSYLSDEQIALIQRFWNTFDPNNISKGQQVFMSLWNALPQVYRGLRDRLEEQQLAYEGMAYRKAIEIIQAGENLSALSSKLYLFVGFNALNTCEERLFRFLKNQNRAEFFWDYDTWYTNNEIHEAGYFIRKNLRNFPPSKPLHHENLLKNNYNQILSIPIASNSGQTGILPYIFKRFGINQSSGLEKTAVVLADENLLIPTLYAMPDYVAEVNITMGYPLTGSAILNLIDSLFELIKNSRKRKDGKLTWYFRDVLAIIENPLLKSFYSEKINFLRQKTLDQNLIYLDANEIGHENHEDIIFNERLLQENPCKLLLEIVNGIIRKWPVEGEASNQADLVQDEILFQVYTFLTRFQDVLLKYEVNPGNDTLFRLIKKMVRNMHIPFNGEPLAGLQVLGILETRTLDFENVILLSANEGILPKAADMPSFIPYNLRAGFGMPTPEHQDAIYAYYFYRLIQRAKNIALVYDCSTGGMRTGERSRFLHQLFYETSLPIAEVNFETTIARIPVKPISIEKKGEVERALEVYLGNDGKVLSPSGINEFLNCPLRFYFHYIAGLPQPEEMSEEIDARMFGNIMHRALKNIYSGFGQMVITRESLEVVLKEETLINAALDKAFSEEVFRDLSGDGSRKPEGFNFIVRQVLYAYIRQFIKKELDSCPFTMISLEDKYVTPVSVNANGKSITLRIGGIIDRIDSRNGKTRILDYKTGSVKNTFPGIATLFNAGEKQRNDAAFQVLLYAYVYSQIQPGADIEPGLFFLRHSQSADFSHLLKLGSGEILESYSGIKQEFEMNLELNLARIVDLKEPFYQTDNLKVCQYCPYAAICRRETGVL